MKFVVLRILIYVSLHLTLSDAVSDVVEDAELTTDQLIRKYKYPAETHFVTTRDNYILQLHRIPRPGGKPILLQHGMADSSAGYILMGPNKSLGYYLYDKGYDVWLGNAQGNRYSRNHTTLNPDTDKVFWDFSWHEIGVNDIPAMIDYILAATGFEKLYYTGHSQGGTALFVMCSMRPEYNNKIILAHALAPAAFLKHVKSPLLPIALNGIQLPIILSMVEFPRGHPLVQTAKACLIAKGVVDFCMYLVYLVMGPNPSQFNKSPNCAALPLFITSSNDEKLDASDAEFVDVIHSNAFVQGKLERCGHLDFYMNGGIYQPGCTGNIFACSHQRAPAYFAESIRSTKGFWGWPCSSYISYLLGFCPPTNNLVEAGENAKPLVNGFFLITTASSSPYALGKWTDLPEIELNREASALSQRPSTRHSPLMKEVDEWGKLEGHFNNIVSFPTPYSQDPNGATWPYFGRSGTKEITQKLKKPSGEGWSSTSNPINRKTSTPSRTRAPQKEQKEQKASQEPNSMWSSYRKNLTMGFIDKSIFQVPKISRS